MIHDHINNLSQYVTVNPNIKVILDFIKDNDLKALPFGKTSISENVYVIHENYTSKPMDACYFESHEIYCDLQLVLDGFESIGHRFNDHENDIVITDAYNPDKDVTKYEVKEFTQVLLNKGMFVIVFPQDLHMPKLQYKTSQAIDKIVFKFKV